MDLVQFLVDEFWLFWPHLLTATYLVMMVVASAHVVMYKKDTRAAIGWIGLILMVPIVGAVLYALLGINRVARKAINLRPGPALRAISAPQHVADRRIVAGAIPQTAHLVNLERLVGQLTGRPLLYGNRVGPLVGGEEAYPQMIDAIDGAKQSVSLATYIFDNDRAGAMFAEALKRAVDRGIEVRVIVDAVGARYSFPSIVGRLERDGVRVARFLPTLMPGRFAYANLRSHRKILVVDGRVGFTGGLNIREGHDARLQPKSRILDHHFRIEGPVVAQMQEVFGEDWAFCTDELLESEKWFPTLEPVGRALARGISAGPDEDLDKRRLALEGALSCAESSVCILTPYFLPD
jgi:cardiolipin synthase